VLGALVQTMITQQRAQGVWNTVDCASAMIALADFTALRRGATQRRVTVQSGAHPLFSVHSADSAITLSGVTLTSLLTRVGPDSADLPLTLSAQGDGAPVFYTITVTEIPKKQPVRPSGRDMFVERWYERYEDGSPVVSVKRGDLVRVKLRVTVPADRQFVVLDDPLPGGLEAVDPALRVSAVPSSDARLRVVRDRDNEDENEPYSSSWRGSYDGYGWSPWEHKELRDDRVIFFTRLLSKGAYTATYVARATTSGTFVRPTAQAEEMYDPAVNGRSDGGAFEVKDP
jgi:uncharacterized protein YfaS (alpha-2-macroglobulin family)